MTDKYVIVHRTFDPVHADLLGDILRENGIFARVLGTRHGAVIGVGQNILQMHIEVPQSQAGEATDFIEAFLSGDAVLDESMDIGAYPAGDENGGADEGENGDEDRDAGAVSSADVGDSAGSGDPPLRPLFGAGAALVLGIIGGGHLYSRLPWVAALLAVGQFLALRNIVSFEWRFVSMGIIMFMLLTLLDLVGGQVAVRAYNRGVRKTALQQLATGALFLALAGSVATFVSHHWSEPKRDEPVSPKPAPYRVFTP